MPLSVRPELVSVSRRVRSAGDDRRIVGSGDRDGHCFGIVQRRAVIIGGADRVGQNQCFAGGQEVERFAAAVEVPGQRVGLGAIENRGRSNRQEALQDRVGQRARNLLPVPLTTTESTAAVTMSVKSASETVSVPLSVKPGIGFGQ